MTRSNDQNPAREDVNREGFKRCSHTLLSQERIQKLNLLLHLISNISGPIVVRGPDGIGKSTVLKEIKSRGLDTWKVCFAEAWSDLTMDRMRQMLSTTASFSVNPSLINDSKNELNEQLKWMEENSQLLVLLLDDADTVEPGLLQSLHQFAESHPALRLVYSMKPDESRVMDDDTMGNWRFVDIPSLTEHQCREFIKSLCADTQRSKSFPEITSSFIHRVYKETHGIPGEILNVLSITPKIRSIGEKNKNTLRSVSIATVVLSLIGLFVWVSSFQDQFFSGKPALSTMDGRIQKKIPMVMPSVSDNSAVEESNNPNAAVEKVINTTETGNLPESDDPLAVKLVPVDTPETTESVYPEKILDKKATIQKKEIIVPQQTKIDPSRGKAPSVGEPDRTSPIPPKNESHDLGIPGVREAEWLLNQKPTKWTVQLIAVSQLDALKSLVEKHSDLKPLAAIRSRTKDKDFFSLYYGSFNTLDAAKIGIKKLPPFFNRPWPIMFQVVHRKIKP